MKKREKILPAILGVIAVLLILYMGLNVVLLAPARKLRIDTGRVLKTIAKMDKQKAIYEVGARRLNDLGRKTLPGDQNSTSEEIRSRIVQLLQESTLGGRSMSLTPSAGVRFKDYYKEIGWIIRDQGPLASVMNFLYLLEAEPYLHRIDNLILAPVQHSGEVKLQLRFATLLLMNPKGRKLPVTERVDFIGADLEGAERKLYDVISHRDLFRPYLRRVVVAKKPPDKPEPAPQKKREQRPPAPQIPDYRVVSLSRWGPELEIHVTDNRKGDLQSLKPGDLLAGGKIVTIDYRAMPMANKQDVISPSRVILKLGSDYYAVELGQNVKDRRRLLDSELPDELKHHTKKLSQAEIQDSNVSRKDN